MFETEFIAIAFRFLLIETVVPVVTLNVGSHDAPSIVNFTNRTTEQFMLSHFHTLCCFDIFQTFRLYDGAPPLTPPPLFFPAV